MASLAEAVSQKSVDRVVRLLVYPYKRSVKPPVRVIVASRERSSAARRGSIVAEQTQRHFFDLFGRELGKIISKRRVKKVSHLV